MKITTQDKQLLSTAIMQSTSFEFESPQYNCLFGIISGRISKPKEPQGRTSYNYHELELDNVIGNNLKEVGESFVEEVMRAMDHTKNSTGFTFQIEDQGYYHCIELTHYYEDLPSQEDIDQYKSDLALYRSIESDIPNVKQAYSQMKAIALLQTAKEKRKAEYEKLKKEFGG